MFRQLQAGRGETTVTSDAREPERIVTEYRDAWGGRAYANLRELVSGSFVLYDPAAPGGAVRGPDGLVAFVRELSTSFPDLQSTVLASLAGKELVMYETHIAGTHEGPFDGHAPTGRAFEIRALEKFRVLDGRLHEHRVCFDGRDFFGQLGLADA